MTDQRTATRKNGQADVPLLIDGVPVVQIEPKTCGISPRRTMQRIVDYKKDPGSCHCYLPHYDSHEDWTCGHRPS